MMPLEYPNTEMLASETARLKVRKSLGCSVDLCLNSTNRTMLFPNHDNHPETRETGSDLVHKLTHQH